MKHITRTVLSLVLLCCFIKKAGATEQFANALPIITCTALLEATTLNGTIASGATSLVVSNASGFPATGTFSIEVDSEVKTVTAVSGNTFTANATPESPTIAATHSNGAPVCGPILTTRALNQIESDVAAGITTITPWDIPLYVASPTASAEGAGFTCDRTIHFPANLAGTVVSCGTNPGESEAWLLQNRGVTQATITIGASAAPIITQQATPAYAAATSVSTAAISINAGRTLVAEWAAATNSFLPTFTSSPAQTWTVCPTGSVVNASGTTTAIAYILSATGGSTTVTATLGASEAQTIAVQAYGNVSAVDLCGAGLTGTSTAVSTGGLTTTNASDLIIAAGGIDVNTTAGAPSGGFTALNITSGGGVALFAAYDTVSATGTYNPTWTAGISDPWAGAILALKGSASGRCSLSLSTQAAFACQGPATSSDGLGDWMTLVGPGTVTLGKNYRITIPATM